jgi:hypothetical protein
MEHVAGHTLRDVIRKESPMAPSRALALVGAGPLGPRASPTGPA